MPAAESYAIILLVYFGTDLISVWGLNLQYGVTGVVNLGYIVMVAAGAYGYSVFSLGPDTGHGGFQTYIIGMHLAPPLAIAGGVVFGALVGGVVGIVGLRGLRPDYQAIASLIVAIIATYVVELSSGLFNGGPGLSLVPNPFGGVGTSNDGWQYVAMVGAACVVTVVCIRRFTNGPLGRSFRAVRMNATAAQAVGKNVVARRLLVQIIGGAAAGLSGALLVGFIGAWAPAGWAYAETLALLTAVIVGGFGNNFGIALGTLLIPIGLLQASQYIPPIGSRPGLAEDIGWILTGLITIGFVWLRPKGLVPDRRPRVARMIASESGLQTWNFWKAGHRGRGDAAERRVQPAGALALPHKEPDPVVSAITDPSPDRPDEDRTILKTQGVVVRYGGTYAVNGVSIELTVNTVTGLIGPNGAGKSSLLSAISGFTPMQGGKLTFDGHDVTRWSAHRRARSGLVRTFQLPQLFQGLTVAENLMVAVTGQRAESGMGVVVGRRYWREQELAIAEEAIELLDLFEISNVADSLGANLSGGQKRMVELARAVMMHPKVLLLDEPRAGLSPRWAEALEQSVHRLKARGMTFVIVEHEFGTIERLCDNVIAMAKGEVLASGSMAALRDSDEVQRAYVAG